MRPSHAPPPRPGGSPSPLGPPLTPANHFLVSLEKQKAVVWGDALPELEDLTEKVKKTGKEVRKADKVADQAALDSFWQ